MVKRCFNLSDENYIKLQQLAREYGVNMVDIINMSIAQFEDKEEDKETIQNLKISVRNCERKIIILYSALNNFFLNFAASMDSYVSPDKTLHRWIEEAEKEEVSRLRQLATKKKWKGSNP